MTLTARWFAIVAAVGPVGAVIALLYGVLALLMVVAIGVTLARSLRRIVRRRRVRQELTLIRNAAYQEHRASHLQWPPGGPYAA